MTTKTHVAPRSGPPFPIVLLSALVAVALAGTGCTPDVPQEAPPAFLELEFDPSASPPKAFQPTVLVTNEETQKLDFSAAGIEIPADPLDCPTDDPALPLAACEFYWYMEQLDGFPTLTPGQTPVITHQPDGTLVQTPLDLATVTMPDNLFVQNLLGAGGPLTDLDVSYDADTGSLVFDPPAGWDIGGLYFVAIRGYENGIKDTAGNAGAKSIIYVLLQQDVPLTCGITEATDPALPECGFYSLFASDARFKDLPAGQKEATIFATLAQLEQLRSTFKGEGLLPFDLWDLAAESAAMPPEEVGILWAFRSHTASVIELNPNKGMVPTVTNNTITLTPKGPIQEDTLKPFSLGDNTGTVFLLDATAYLGGDLVNALPGFTIAYVEGEIVLTTTADLIVGHQYIVVVSSEVEGKPGVPIVPSPLTVFLRTRGALVADFAVCATAPETAIPLAPGLKGPDACQAEAGRQQLQALLDSETVIDLTKNANRPDGLVRELVAYLVAFEHTAQ